MESFDFSKGALRDVFSVSKSDSVVGPLTCLVKYIKPIQVENELKRYRLILADGEYSCHSLVDEKTVPYLSNNGFARNSVLKIKEYSVFSTIKKLIFLINDVEIIGQVSPSPDNIKLISIDQYFQENPEEDKLHFNRNLSPAPVSTPIPNNTVSKPTTSTSSAGSTSSSGLSDEKVVPIDNISPYRNFWTIKARVSYKGDLRTWQNKNNEGKLFSVNFLDESDEIKASAFNDDAENAHKILEEGKVYYISNAKVRAKNAKFNHLPNPYELILDKGTKIQECYDTSNVPKLSFKFVKLDKVQNLDSNSIVDVIGALKTVSEAYQITARTTGKAFDRRNVTIVDETGYAIEVGLWNSLAVNFNIPEGSIIAFKGVKVQEFNGKSLTLTQSGSVVPSPDVPEAYQLKGWYDHEGVNKDFATLKVESSSSSSNFFNRRITIEQAQNDNLGKSDKPDYFTVKASVSFPKQDTFSYPACNNQVQLQDSTRPATSCNRKMIEQPDGTWRCERCDITANEPTYRYILNCAIMDSTNQIWITLFDAEAAKILGISAGELLKLQRLKESDESNTEFVDVFHNILFKEFNFRIKAKQDTYNDAVRVRYQCAGVDPIDFKAEAEYLASQLETLLK
ncbi:DNA replication factor A [Scheffersomyces amazonensis]|uniref:DNA replication factor A n=1 Tax=Scheffersomyces amazonensis TaxID=1078765 RepID=UPI00315D2D41